MSRRITVAAAQIGAVHLDTPRESVLKRMIQLLDQAVSQGAQIVVFPETAFTTFFPRHLINEQSELDAFFEHGADPTDSPNMQPLLARATELQVDIYVGYAERTPEGVGYNTCIYYSGSRKRVLNKYRKVHIPGTVEPIDKPDAINQLEKRYFTPGDLGFEAFRVPDLIAHTLKSETNGKSGPCRELEGKGDPIVGMIICNDRRWPESWRSLALQGTELVLCGYNSVGYAPDIFGAAKQQTMESAEQEAIFHHKLVMQANSYMNSCFSVCAARAGMDDGKHLLIGASCITNSEGHILAESKGKEDEVVLAQIDLEECREGKEKLFDFARHRRPKTYAIISEQVGVVEPAFLSQND